MKQIKILTVVVVCSMFFSACKKDNMAAEPSLSASNADRAVVNYKIVSDPLPGKLIYWKTGTMHVDKINFNALWLGIVMANNTNVGAASKSSGIPVNYSADINQYVNVFQPYLVGNMLIPAGAYSDVRVELTLTPPNVPDMPKYPPFAFSASGTLNTVNGPLSVQLIIDDALAMNANTPGKVMFDKDMQNTPILTIDLNMLCNEVDADMLLRGEWVNSVLVITKKQNVNLYNIMRNNLHSAIHVQFR